MGDGEEMKADSPEALMWGIICNEHGYTPRPGDVVLDIGAHHGYFALFCAARGAAVVAYEPSMGNILQIREKAAIAEERKFPPIVCHQQGVWSESGYRLLWLDENNSGAHSMVRACSETSYMVQTVTLSQALNEGNWQCVKVDVEGAEAQIFLSAKRKDFEKIEFLTLEMHSHALTAEQDAALVNRLKAEFLKVLTFPEISDGLPTGRTAKVFCWNVK